jgi:hypothetical protein
MKKSTQLVLTMGILFLSFNASAKLVENGENFNGRFKVVEQEFGCGWSPDLENSVLGLVDVYGQVSGIRIQSVVANYSEPGGLVDWFDFGVVDRLNEKVEYVSSYKLTSFRRFKTGSNDPIKEVTSELTIDLAGNLILSEQKNYGTGNLLCHYTRIN